MRPSPYTPSIISHQNQSSPANPKRLIKQPIPLKAIKATKQQISSIALGMCYKFHALERGAKCGSINGVVVLIKSCPSGPCADSTMEEVFSADWLCPVYNPGSNATVCLYLSKWLMKRQCLLDESPMIRGEGTWKEGDLGKGIRVLQEEIDNFW